MEALEKNSLRDLSGQEETALGKKKSKKQASTKLEEDETATSKRAHQKIVEVLS
jgi:hypothetical protein